MRLLQPLLFLTLLNITFSAVADVCDCKISSHTFFSVRPQFGVASQEVLSMWRHQQNLQENECHRHTFQAVLFGGRSTRPKKIGTYFFPFCSPTADVTSVIDFGTGKLFAQNFNIPSILFTDFTRPFTPTSILSNPFSSVISVSPRQSTVGLGLSYQHNFRGLCGMEYWFRVNAPIVYVQNSMNLEEVVTATGIYSITPIPGTNLADPQHNMTEALSQSSWLYGKIDNKKHKKTRLAFIQAQLGMVPIDSECCYFSPYIGLNIPTGNKVKAEFVFEPIVGNGKHFGLFWGFDAEFFAWRNQCNDFELSVAIDVNMEYLFKNTQRRSFDLKGRSWTRYIEVYSSREQAAQALDLSGLGQEALLQATFLNSPGINILTQKLHVRPKFNFTSNFAIAALQICDRGFEGEIGYNFYAKQAECVSFKDPFVTTAAIKDAIGQSATNPVRDITQNRLLNEASILDLFVHAFNLARAEERYTQSIIKESDIDLNSATHPATFSNIIYAVGGYHWHDLCHPVMTSIGISYEFSPQSNVALNRWLLWGRIGVSI